jgi:uncharacterized protein (TIGR02145 family)
LPKTEDHSQFGRQTTANKLGDHSPVSIARSIKMPSFADEISDIEGNIYKTLTIGSQIWTIDNLRTTKYNDGIPIPTAEDRKTWHGLGSPSYCFFNNNNFNKGTWGALYNWYAINTKRLAPAGWHVPTDQEWDILRDYLIANGYNWDGSTIANKIAKSLAAQSSWKTFTTPGTIGHDLHLNNSSGFSALPGGYRTPSSVFDFDRISIIGSWWCSTECDSLKAYSRSLSITSEQLIRDEDDKTCGFHVRLLKDNC